jgi:hypothetical protein
VIVTPQQRQRHDDSGQTREQRELKYASLVRRWVIFASTGHEGRVMAWRVMARCVVPLA